MESNSKAKLLRFHISNTDKLVHTPLSDAIVYSAKRNGLAGATVFKGYMGYGSSAVVHSTKIWDVSEKIPVVVEIIDTNDKIDGYLEYIIPWFDKISTGCLITTEEVNVVISKKGTKKSFFGL